LIVVLSYQQPHRNTHYWALMTLKELADRDLPYEALKQV
jgi:hypothetical protein